MVSIKKGYAYTLLAAVVILFVSLALVYATGYSSDQPSHTTLYADTVRGKTGGTVIVSDGLTVNSAVELSARFTTGLDLTSTHTDFGKLPLTVTSQRMNKAAKIYGNVEITAPYANGLTVSVNRSATSSADVLHGFAYAGPMNVAPDREVVLGNISYAVYGRTDDNYVGYLGGVDPFAVGKAGVAGLATSTRGGTLGTANYGIYGQYDATKKGYLGSASYGAYGQYDGSNYGYLGSLNTGVYGRGTAYGVYGWSTGGAGTWAGYFTGGDGIYVSNHVYAHGAHLAGADLAEKYESQESLEAGDVVVIDTETKLQKARKAFDKRVVGAISSDPGLLLNKGSGGYPLALSGKVPVKVSAENGAIEVGDLLTTASTPGYAMKCKKTDDCFGAVLGKALEPLSSGKGKILTLVFLN